jgi:outer membrane protein assembly factor BamB
MAEPQTSRRREPLIAENKRLYVGIGDSVLAFDPNTGEEFWRTKLKKLSTFVSVSFIHGRVFAAANGEIYCLDPATGEVLWHNPLKGMGMGYVTFTGEGASGDMGVSTAMAEGISSSIAAT